MRPMTRNGGIAFALGMLGLWLLPSADEMAGGIGRIIAFTLVVCGGVALLMSSIQWFTRKGDRDAARAAARAAGVDV